MKSRPVYTTLQPNRAGRCHLLVGEGAGGEALLRLVGQLPAGADVRLLYADGPNEDGQWAEPLAALGLPALRLCSSPAEAVAALDQALLTCGMGTRLYASGAASFLGACVQVARRRHLSLDAVQCEQRGSTARRVYCVHCQSSNEDVTTNVVRCSGCGRCLFVRDHYSRRLAAYMGVMVDAEAPGELPPVQEVFP